MSIISELEKTLNIDVHASTLDPIAHPVLQQHGIQLYIKRDDKIHPIISGNKWRKLKYILAHALEMGYDHFISMGGAYSNHLHALAFIGHQCGLKTTGLIRGEKLDHNPTIDDLERWGMQCVFVDRTTFRHLRHHKEHDSPPAQTYSGYWIPEGGSCKKALTGVNELLQEIRIDFDYISLPCGTGTTLAGISQTLPEASQAIGFSALKNSGFLETDITDVIGHNINNWAINNDYHFGGFAKHTDKLLRFIDEFESLCSISLEPIYTGKMFYGLFDMIQSGFFRPGVTIVACHTGGLQGYRKTL